MRACKNSRFCVIDAKTLFLLTGGQSNYEKSLQMSRSVWKLQRSNLLDAAGRLQGGGELPKDKAPARQEAGDGQEANESW